MRRVSHQSCSGFSLVEVALAVGIIGFVLVLLIGLIAIGLKTNKVSADEVNAAGLAYNIWVDLKHSPTTNPISDTNLTARLGLPTPLSITTATTSTYTMNADGTLIGTAATTSTQTQGNATAGNTAYSVILKYFPSGASQTPLTNQPVIVSVAIIWPANSKGYSNGSWRGIMTFAQPQAQYP
jgi:uncharacterized protein (TIGR02598 family)